MYLTDPNYMTETQDNSHFWIGDGWRQVLKSNYTSFSSSSSFLSKCKKLNFTPNEKGLSVAPNCTSSSTRLFTYSTVRTPGWMKCCNRYWLAGPLLRPFSLCLFRDVHFRKRFANYFVARTTWRTPHSIDHTNHAALTRAWSRWGLRTDLRVSRALFFSSVTWPGSTHDGTTTLLLD